MALKLVGNVAGKTVPTLESDGSLKLEATVGEKLELKWLADPDSVDVKEVTLLRGGEPYEVEWPTTGHSGSTSFVLVEGTHSFTCTGKEGDSTTTSTSTPLVVFVAKAADDPVTPKTPEPGVDESAVGEYDKPFAAWTFVAVLALSIVVLVAGLMIVAAIKIPNQAFIELGDNQQVYGTWSERLGSIVAVVTLVVGAIVLLLGVWMGGLETRGRLRDPKLAAEAAKAQTRAGSVDGDAIAAVLEKLRRMRATVAVIAAGALLVLCALWSMTSIASVSLDQPDPAPSATP